MTEEYDGRGAEGMGSSAYFNDPTRETRSYTNRDDDHVPGDLRMRMLYEEPGSEQPSDGAVVTESMWSVISDGFRDSILDLYAASKIFCLHLVTYESMFVVLVSVLATTLYYVYGHRSDGSSFGANLSWIIVSFAIVSPMIMQIKQAFVRRERALELLAEAKSLFVNILLANTLWNWGSNDRVKLPAGHASKTKYLLQRILLHVTCLLLLPTITRGRHRFTKCGRQVAARFREDVNKHYFSIMVSFRDLHQQVEVMKSMGLPANEASRINQYHWLLQARLEKVLNYKFYRTPQATRSFTRLFILVLPIFYGPYYIYLMKSDEHHSTSFVFSLIFSVVTSLTMIGVFNVEKAMEDPFVGGGLDGVRVRETMAQLHRMLDICHDDNRPEKDTPLP